MGFFSKKPIKPSGAEKRASEAAMRKAWNKKLRKERWKRTSVDVRTNQRVRAPLFGFLDRIVTPKPDPKWFERFDGYDE